MKFSSDRPEVVGTIHDWHADIPPNIATGNMALRRTGASGDIVPASDVWGDLIDRQAPWVLGEGVMRVLGRSDDDFRERFKLDEERQTQHQLLVRAGKKRRIISHMVPTTGRRYSGGLAHTDILDRELMQQADEAGITYLIANGSDEHNGIRTPATTKFFEGDFRGGALVPGKIPCADVINMYVGGAAINLQTLRRREFWQPEEDELIAAPAQAVHKVPPFRYDRPNYFIRSIIQVIDFTEGHASQE